MSARKEPDANFSAMIAHSSALWSLHATVKDGKRGVWAISQSAVPPTPDAIAEGKAAVREVRMVRRSTGPGWKAEGAVEQTGDVFGVVDHPSTEQAAA